MVSALARLDGEILLFIQERIRNAFLDSVMVAASHAGDRGLIWIALGILLLAWPKTRRGAVNMLICLGVAAALNNLVLKNLLARERPYLLVEGLFILVDPENSHSFPSGHTCSSFAAATALFMAFGKKGALAFPAAALIGFSRVYAGVHYSSDVLAGALFGAAVALAVYFISGRAVKNGARPGARRGMPDKESAK